MGANVFWYNIIVPKPGMPRSPLCRSVHRNDPGSCLLFDIYVYVYALCCNGGMESQFTSAPHSCFVFVLHAAFLDHKLSLVFSENGS